MISCERLIFLAPSIEALVSSSFIQNFCVSPIRSTQPYLKCCYISFQNFLIEIIEVTDITQANQFAFFEDAQNLTCPKWVGIGLRTNNLDLALERLKKNEINALEHFTSNNSRYNKGYKHRSASLSLQWFEKLVYVSEYDAQFFKERESGISTNIDKKQMFSVLAPEVLEPFYNAPTFLQLNGSLPQIEVTVSGSIYGKTMDCDWLTLKINKSF